jgi:hypothetical protein
MGGRSPCGRGDVFRRLRSLGSLLRHERDVPRSGGFFYGRPAFVLAGVAATAIGNAARKSAATRAEQTTWRECQVSRVIVTNQRLVCFANGRALSFYYSGMTAVYPEVDRWTLVCEFGDSERLLISGDDSPLVSLMTVCSHTDRTRSPSTRASPSWYNIAVAIFH